MKKLARPRNECNANLVSFCRANRKRSQKISSQAIIQVKCGRAEREGGAEVGSEGKGRRPGGVWSGRPRDDGDPQKRCCFLKHLNIAC